MKKQYRYLIRETINVFTFLILYNGVLLAQVVLNSAGGHASINGNYYAWSIGEMVLVNTSVAESIILTQGYLQPFVPEKGSSIKSSDKSFRISIYPSMVKDFLFSESEMNDREFVEYRLYDSRGMEIRSWKSYLEKGIRVYTDLSKLTPSIYFLHLIVDDNNRHFTTYFKFLKI